MARLRDSWCISLPVDQQPRNPQSESIARSPYEAPQRRSAGIMPMVVPLVVGLVVGAAASWALLFGTLDRATPFVNGFLYWFLPVLGVSAAVLAVTVPLAWWGLRHFVKGARGTLEQVVKE